MASGPAHYRRAEELLFNAYDAATRCRDQDGALRAALVHAVLALTAGTVTAAVDVMDQEEFLAWERAFGEPS